MKYFTKELSIFEMNKRLFIVWFWKRFTKVIGKIIEFEESIFGVATRVARLIGTLAAIKGIESLSLLCENEKERNQILEKYHLELDILRANYAQLKGGW